MERFRHNFRKICNINNRAQYLYAVKGEIISQLKSVEKNLKSMGFYWMKVSLTMVSWSSMYRVPVALIQSV